MEQNSYIPFYIQVKKYIENKINSGEWQPGERIPTEQELQQMFNMSRITVRQAISQLENIGLVVKKQGKGTYVSFAKISHNLLNLTSFTEDITAKGLNPKSIVLSIEKGIYHEISEKINVDMNTELIYIKRLRLINDEEVGIHHCYINNDIANIVDLNILKEPKISLYQVLEKERHINISYADETLEGGAADKAISKLLKIKVNDPLLIVERVTYTSDNLPIEYVKMHYRADKYKYSLRLLRK